MVGGPLFGCPIVSIEVLLSNLPPLLTTAIDQENMKSFELCLLRYDSFSDVGESWVWLRANFQSGSRVLKKVFWTFSYLYLWHTMWFHAKKLLKTLKFWKSLNSLCKSGSRPQKSPKKAQKTDHSIAIYSIFWIAMVYTYRRWYLVNPHVQTVQNMYGKVYVCPTSGRQNTVKKGSQPLFAQKAFVPLCITAFSPFMAHHNISLRFWAGGRRVKKFSFSQICVSLW